MMFPWLLRFLKAFMPLRCAMDVSQGYALTHYEPRTVIFFFDSKKTTSTLAGGIKPLRYLYALCKPGG